MIINNIKIRYVEKTEISELQKIGENTFAETFVNDCSHSDMKKYLHNTFNSKLLITELKNPESDFFFAELDGNIIGYLKLNKGKAQTEQKLENAIEIERLYVLAKFQGKKVGQMLMDKSLEIAKSKLFARIWLGVWENNSKAIRFYKKNGFVKFDSHIFNIGDDEQIDILMKLEL